MKKLLVMGILLLGVVGCEGTMDSYRHRIICKRLLTLAQTKADTNMVRDVVPNNSTSGICSYYVEVDSLSEARYR
jgi:hypothetical protein